MALPCVQTGITRHLSLTISHHMTTRHDITRRIQIGVPGLPYRAYQ